MSAPRMEMAPFGFEDGQMNTVGVGVPVLAQHRL